MSDALYVATDSEGNERLEGGSVAWILPDNSAPSDSAAEPTTGASAAPVILRRPIALLDVLDECIFEAEPVGPADVGANGVARVGQARLVAPTGWDTESAARWALDCAEHELGEGLEIRLPDGTDLTDAITRARRILDEDSGDGQHRLGYLARLSALRRLRHERSELATISLEQLNADDQRDLAAIEDPIYASVLPVTDAVLAAIECLRHHVLPHAYLDFERRRGQAEQKAVVSADFESTIGSTPWGTVALGGTRVLGYEPAYSAAREGARHARHAAELRGGSAAEQAERAWQADRLEQYLRSHLEAH